MQLVTTRASAVGCCAVTPCPPSRRVHDASSPGGRILLRFPHAAGSPAQNHADTVALALSWERWCNAACGGRQWDGPHALHPTPTGNPNVAAADAAPCVKSCLHGCSQHAIALGSMHGAHLTAIPTPNQADETSRSRQSSSSAAHHGHVQGAATALLVARHGSVRAGARWWCSVLTQAPRASLFPVINHPAGCCIKMAAPLWKPWRCAGKRGEVGWYSQLTCVRCGLSCCNCRLIVSLSNASQSA